MKHFILICFALGCFSCIPLRIAPSIKTDKVMVAKKFKRKLPKRYAFIFEDPKDADEFYNYVNTKYALNHQDVAWNVPFEVNGSVYYFSFHEVEITTKTFNILPVFIDAALQSNDKEPFFEDSYISRTGSWYVAVTVADALFNDCLKPDYINREAILKYLRNMRVEYLNTSNYLEAFLKQ
ncbi:hypothetical protein [Siansivirga zeaxanthinifaciens]|uniref:Uncharacterized protein n=1 Tax=Siansivirga zeaxanthinifaciens CC-SAMT-1 TaxID=1454006 RepID=A0A0C5WCL5_9FLAO|nr:hypothetical protein [Siansivirga zeaxanthinifaciens]AJR04743.1 hypothetical protein AW14_02990 [Siansivirga zeaxanthinifaciens CC-SAMT-1]